MGRTHALSGAVGMLAVTPAVAALAPSLTPHGPVALAAGTVVAAGAALLPDLDHPRATVARSLGPVTGALSKVVAAVSGGHRQATHSVAGVLLAAGLFGVAGSAGGWWAWVPVTLLAGLAV
ncbi:MAG TPA: metal-dependent hydrolase, partial [Mycobacteriales bacterium]